MKTKIIVFDFDGTISKVEKGFNCWRAIWEELDAIEIDRKYYNMYNEGKITYLEWCRIIEEEFVARNVNKDMMEQIGKRIELMDNAEEFFKILENKNIKSYILSGGIRNMIEASLGDLKQYLTDIQADYFTFDEDGKMKNLCLCNGHSVERKDEFVNILLRENDLQPEEVLFVGNGANDEDVYKSGVRTLCFNPDGANYKDKNIWNATVWSDSLLDVLPYIDN